MTRKPDKVCEIIVKHCMMQLELLRSKSKTGRLTATGGFCLEPEAPEIGKGWGGS